MQRQSSGKEDKLNFSWHDVTSGLARHRKLALTVFGLLAIGTVLIVLLLPNKYESRMKILVKQARADVIVTPERTNGPTDNKPEGITEAQINSEIQLLASKDLLLQVVKDKQLDQAASGWLQFSDTDPAIRAEKAARQLEKNLRVGPIKKSSLIEARYEAASPQAAIAVLQRVADLYLEKHLKAHRPPGTHEFFAEQVASYEKQLRETQTRLSEHERNLNVVSLDVEKDLNLRKLIEAKSGMLTSEAALNDVTRRIELAQRELIKLDPRVVTQSRLLPYQQSVESINTMLVELRNRRTQLLNKFRPEDRLVQEVEQQIKDTTAALESARKQTAIEQSSNLNPLRQTMETELNRAKLEQAGLRAKRETLAEQVRGYEELLARLEKGSIGHDDLARQVKTLEENFQLYTRKRDEALIADALDQRKIANVALVEPPTFSPLPSSPNRWLSLALGLFIALFVSLGSVVVAELLGDKARLPRPGTAPEISPKPSPWPTAGYAD